MISYWIKVVFYHSWDRHFSGAFLGMVLLDRLTCWPVALLICGIASLLKELHDNGWVVRLNSDTLGDLISDTLGILFYLWLFTNFPTKM